MEVTVTPLSDSEKPKKRVRNPSAWKKNILKESRYAAKGSPKFPTCPHEKGAFLCKTLDTKDLMSFHQNFYQNVDKISQDNFILKHVETQKIKRRRSRNMKNKILDGRTKYFISNRLKEKVPVCQNTFLNCLGISRFRVTRIAQVFHEWGEIPKERRGGDTTEKRYLQKKQSIVNFINKFHCIENIDCVHKIGCQNISPELNVKKMWQIYQTEVEEIPALHVKLSYFRNIFRQYSETLDTAEHALYQCPIWEENRFKAESSLEGKLEPANMVEVLLESRESWQNMHNTINTALLTKEAKERARQSRESSEEAINEDTELR